MTHHFLLPHLKSRKRRGRQANGERKRVQWLPHPEMGGQAVLRDNCMRTLAALEHPRWSKDQPDVSLMFTSSCFTGSAAAGLAVVLWLRRCLQMFAINKTLQHSTQNSTALGLLVQLCADYSSHRPPPQTVSFIIEERFGIVGPRSPEKEVVTSRVSRVIQPTVFLKKKKVQIILSQIYWGSEDND